MKRPTLTEAAIGLTFAVGFGAPLGFYLAEPPPTPAPTQACVNPAAQPDLSDICQVGSIRNT